MSARRNKKSLNKRKRAPSPVPPRRHSAPVYGISRAKKLLFALITVVAMFVIGELVLALAGVRPTIATSDPYVGFRSASPLFTADTNESGRRVFRTAQGKRGLFNDQSFPVHKGKNAYRIFCMGGSTTHGRPYRDKTSFSGWMRLFLQAADPSRQWEVVNCGGVSYASYRVAALMEELGAYAPDLYVIYTGNNEFLERRTYSGIIEEHPAVTQFNLLLHRSRIASVVRNVVRPASDPASREAIDKVMLTGEVKPILDQSAGLELYERDADLKEQILSHFRFNLGRMVAIARAQGAQVLFIQPACNVKDFSPFKSQHTDGLPPQDRDVCRNLIGAGEEAMESGDHAAATDAFSRAILIDPRYAEAHFQLGRALLAQNKFAPAHLAFRSALIEDVCPLRVLPRMNTIIADVSGAHSVDVVDFAGSLESRCENDLGHRMLGAEYFIDHVHPTIETNRWIAELVLERLQEFGVFQPTREWTPARRDALAQTHVEEITEYDHAIARGVLAKVLRWAGKIEESNRLIDSAADVLADDAEGAVLLGKRLEQEGDLEGALQKYRRALEVNPNFVDAHLHVARLYIRRRELPQAVAAYEAAKLLAPESPTVAVSLGLALTELGRYDDALAEFHRALRLQPDSMDARLGTAGALLGQNRYQEAIDACHGAIRAAPNAAEPLRQLALVYQRMGRMDEAVQQLRKAVAVAPADAAAHASLAQALAHTNDVEGAIQHYERTTELDDSAAEAYFHLGLLHAQRRNYPAAVRPLQRAVSLFPESQSAVANLGQVLTRVGDLAAAMQTYRAAVAHWPNDARFKFKLAWLLATAPDEELRNGAEAVRLVEAAVAVDADVSYESLYTKAAAYAETGQFAQAVAIAEEAIEKAQQAGRADFASYIQQQATAYENGVPFRIPMPRQAGE